MIGVIDGAYPAPVFTLEELLAKIGVQLAEDVIAKVRAHPDYVATVEAYATHAVDVVTGRAPVQSASA